MLFSFVCPIFVSFLFFFFNDTATTEIYTLSLHDALPIWRPARVEPPARTRVARPWYAAPAARSDQGCPGAARRVPSIHWPSKWSPEAELGWIRLDCQGKIA